ncbi:Protoporphyrinogen oxidase [Streptomyces sp. RB5]|uniref:Coproporphyrinogen III oxidase n=1 Tax=Streptomyces smaragdinus TaxID=2585196 RepID=A0A7K0CQ01_9ACTN|nr:protoporphyrinogen oxidase [Streptomyces smaragdinus]MQY15568.1 Protoporphyrinogen oxidase [Streptomyces smaragdinus]
MKVLVIGGGIAGLAAARRLVRGGAEVTVLEAADRVGGKLYAGELEGLPLDLGAESLLARRPEAVGLARDVGLGDALQPVAMGGAAVWTRGELRPMPRGHVMGIPGSPEAVAGVVSEEGVEAVRREASLPAEEVGEDVGVGEYVARRFGREVVDRLVEPLLGGVYAGDAYRISLRAAMPALFDAVREHPTLTEAVHAVQGATPAGSGPVFLGIDGGIGRLPLAVADDVRAAGGTVRTGVTVTALRPVDGGWRALTEDAKYEADAVVLALPAGPAARLLRVAAPDAARELDEVEYASMALVSMAFRRQEVEDVLPAGTGFLVPSVDGRTIKASTFSSRKWDWAGDDELFLLRTSVGRYGDTADLEREDGELVDLSLKDLHTAVGLAAKPVASLVTRWNDGLPQYAVGHVDRVGRIRAALPAGVVVCGALYDGVGIPAVIASADRAAAETLGAPGTMDA